MAKMRHIDEEQLENDLQYRYEFLAEFVGFGLEDAGLIQASAPILAPLIPQLVEETYVKLLAYDATARHFVPRQSGYQGETPASLDDLSAVHAQIQFRKEHLAKYLLHVVTRAADRKLPSYLDMVGKIHTAKAGSVEIDVPLVQMNALMGLLAITLTNTIMAHYADGQAAMKTIRAFEKLMWIQNDFINRHYQAEVAVTTG